MLSTYYGTCPAKETKLSTHFEGSDEGDVQMTPSYQSFRRSITSTF